MITTPTKNGVHPNDSMKPSIDPTRISDSTASRPAVARSTMTATVALQAGPAWPSGSPCPPSTRSGLVNAYTSDSP